MSRDYVLHTLQKSSCHQVDYASELNEQQYAAVTSGDGDALVIAGAGAGKTRTLIYRVAWLLEEGVPPEAILLLTFTNKAAREMMDRVRQLTDGDWGRLWGGTFHSIGRRILIPYAERLGFKSNFLILDRPDSKELLAACIKDAKIETKGKQFPKPDVLLEMFSSALNLSVSLENLIEDRYSTFCEKTDQIRQVYDSYTQRKLEQNKMDFDDLLTLPVRLFKENPDILEVYQNRFRYILVDEYQDTNQLQNELVEMLSAQHGNLMVVGDDAQSIYSWRGACFKNILEFTDRHPQAVKYLIEKNYRSTSPILETANASIANNIHQFPKTLQAVRTSDTMPALVSCSNGYTQAEFIAQRVSELHATGTPLHKMAVLYRAHHHAMELQMELRKCGIPFIITSGIRFFEQAHIKDITSFLRIAYSPADEVAFKRLVLKLPAVGPAAADKLWKLFAGSEWPESLTAGFERCTPKVPAKAKEGWEEFFKTMKSIDPVEHSLSVAEMIRKCLEGCAEDWMRAEYDNADIRLDDVGQLSIYSEKFESLDDFLSDMALQTNMDGETANLTNTEQEDALNLSTIHQAKGLEYDVVFVIMLCEGMFPSYRSIENPDSLEEERRLFYVALTRAKDELYLVWPKLRNAMGQFERQLPSRFIKEIQSENLLEEWNLIPPHERIPADEDEEDEDDFSEDENYSQEEDAPF